MLLNFFILYSLSSFIIFNLKTKIYRINFWWRKCEIHLSNLRRKTNWMRCGRHTKNDFMCNVWYWMLEPWFLVHSVWCCIVLSYMQNIITMSQFILLKTASVKILGGSFRICIQNMDFQETWKCFYRKYNFPFNGWKTSLLNFQDNETFDDGKTQNFQWIHQNWMKHLNDFLIRNPHKNISNRNGYFGAIGAWLLDLMHWYSNVWQLKCNNNLHCFTGIKENWPTNWFSVAIPSIRNKSVDSKGCGTLEFPWILEKRRKWAVINNGKQL